MSKNEIKLPEELVPFSANTLTEIDIHRAVVAQALSNVTHNAKLLAEYAMLLEDDDARKLLARKEVHNIKNSATEISQYFGMIQLLLGHLKEDWLEICKKREVFKETYAARMIEVNKKQTQVETEIAEKRPANRPVETE